jgi:hypothetical protein
VLILISPREGQRNMSRACIWNIAFSPMEKKKEEQKGIVPKPYGRVRVYKLPCS